MIRAYLVGREDLVAHLQQHGPRVRDALRRAILAAAIETQGIVQTEKLSGQVLGVVHDVLRPSVTKRITEDGSRITGIVGTKVWYGRLWEYGFSRMQGAGTRGGKVTDKYLARNPPHLVHYAERSFLRSTLAERLPAIRDRISLYVSMAVKNG